MIFLELDKYLSEALDNVNALAAKNQGGEFESALNCILEAIERGGRILVCGNGGSHADALHFAGELVNFFTKPHRALPVVTLGANSVVSSAWANDHNYESQFAREVEAYGSTESVLIGFTTSGRSRNIIESFLKGRSIGMKVIAFTGLTGGALLADFADHILITPSDSTPRIQEGHIILYHALCAELESRFTNLESENQ